jgi:hypothetical protein
MPAQSSNLKQDVTSIFGWAIVTPALAFWPFVSAAPAFTLWAGAGGAWDATLQLIFLATGFWGAFGVFLFAEYARNRTMKLMPSGYRNGYGLMIGAYATVWTVAYALSLYVMR